jgi:Fe2+ transport system protein FeoA
MMEATVAMNTHSTHSTHCRLDQVAAGTRCTVESIESGEIAIQRLMAMGLCVGRQVEIVRHGNPLIVRLLGARIGVSARVARHIIVERAP